MEQLILARYGEVGLKGKNRRFFENQLIKQMEQALDGLPLKGITRTYGRIYVTMAGEVEEALRRLSYVLGLVAVSPTQSAPLDLEEIKAAAVRAMQGAAAEGYTCLLYTSPQPTKGRFPKNPESLCVLC